MIEKEKPATIEHYPFKSGESQHSVRHAIRLQIQSLICEIPNLKEKNTVLEDYLMEHFLFAESLFCYEEQAREEGIKDANLFYHGKEHAVYQTTYDVLYVLRSILKREDALSAKLTPEGIVSAFIAAVYHDSGYVAVSKLPCNYAARTPIHVSESIKMAYEALEKIEAPSFLDMAKIKKLTALGIYSTSFPFGQEQKEKIQEQLLDLDLPQKREAQIVRLAVQLADLGGQTARIDYTSELVLKLRKEMNGAASDLGTKIIGEDAEVAQKSTIFINHVVKPTVGKTANALLGKKDHQFAKEWERQLK